MWEVGGPKWRRKKNTMTSMADMWHSGERLDVNTLVCGSVYDGGVYFSFGSSA